jgi:hypothetical protein
MTSIETHTLFLKFNNSSTCTCTVFPLKGRIISMAVRGIVNDKNLSGLLYSSDFWDPNDGSIGFISSDFAGSSIQSRLSFNIPTVLSGTKTFQLKKLDGTALVANMNLVLRVEVEYK